MSFQQILTQFFPNALLAQDYVARTYQELLLFGFNASNSIACVGVCRDEITRPLVDEIQTAWGEAFNFSGLGGMLFLGKTGFLAAKHHSPRHEGRERYVYFAFAHVAIGPNGEYGLCYRSKQSEPSTACGALVAFRKELVGGCLKLDLDPDDIEHSLLKQRLFHKIRYGDVPDLISLTRLAHLAITEDLERMIGLTVDSANSDYAVFTGIQVHGPQNTNYIWTGAHYAVVNTELIPIVFS